MLRAWWPSAMFLFAGIVFATTGTSVPLAVALVVIAFLLSPLVFPRSLTHAEAMRRGAADGRPIVYWRPACQYCLNLRLRLGRSAARAHWVNIWKDPQAAAAVRAIAGGNETVPTVVTPAESAVNPDPAWVLERLR